MANIFWGFLTPWFLHIGATSSRVAAWIPYSNVGRSKRLQNGRALDDDGVLLMYRPDQYLAVVVGLMFLAGIVRLLYSLRQRSRTRQLNDTRPTRRHRVV